MAQVALEDLSKSEADARCLLPPSTQRSIQLYNRDKFVSSDLCKAQFTIEKIAVRIECAQKRIDTTLIPAI